MQLTRNRVSILVACSTILVIVFFFTAPIVQYLVTVSIPRNYGDRAYEACQSLASNSTHSMTACARIHSHQFLSQGKTPLLIHFSRTGKDHTQR